MLKNRLLVLSFFMLSANLLANGSVDEKLDMGLEKINEIEKKVVYDREIVNDRAQSISVGDGEKVSVVYNVDHDAAGSYVIFSNSKPDSIKLVNNGKLESNSEVFTSRHDHDYSNLIHFTNNGIINGTGSVENALTLYAPYVYYKNGKGSRLYGKHYKPLIIDKSKIAFVDNAGEIINAASIDSKKESFLINRKDGFIDKVWLSSGEKAVFKNEGEITDLLTLNAKESIDFENNGKIKGDLTIEKNNLSYGPSYGYEEEKILKTTFINNENGVLEFLKSRFSFEIDSPELDFVNKGVIIYSKEGIVKKEDYEDKSTNKYEYETSVGKILITHFLGRFVNENKIDGTIRFTEKVRYDIPNIRPFEIHLENGTINGSVDIEYDKRSSKYKRNEIIVSVNKEGNVTEKIDARNRFNETLILLGKDTLSDSEKFLGFEKIHLKDADWKFKDLNIEAKNELLVENSNLTLDGGVISTTILNNENDSNLKVSKETTINGNLINKGNIIFENNPINYSILNINGDYSGENGKILLRVKVEDSPKLTDKLIINGNASGNTNIEISNPGSTLAQKMKEKVKIIETNTSEYDTFTLLNPEHSNYIYKLFSKEEGNKKNWYLIQEFAGPTDDFGLIINSMYLGQQHFNFNFLEHSKYIIEKNNNFWIKTSNINNYNKLSNRKDISIPIKSNTTTTIMGYDLLKNSKNDEEKKLGIFGNLGVNSSKSMESEISSISGILGAGIYGTWKKKDFYVDGWINYTYLQNRINIETPINYGLHSLRTSTEFGINGDMNIGNLGRLHANHHLQLTYSYVTNPKIKVLEGEEIEYIGNHNLTSKLGTNLIFYTKNKYLKPFIEFNWSYGINLVGLKLGEDKYYYDGNKDVMEIKWGLKEIEINDNLTLWGNILHQFTEKKYRTHGVELGLLYKF